MWWNKHKWKLLLPLLIAAALALAFWYGGDAPGLRGLPSPSPAAALLSPSPSPTSVSAPSPSPSLPPSPVSAPSPSPSLPPSPTPVSVPSPSPSPSPTPTSAPTPTPSPSPEPEPAPPTCTLSISCAEILDNMDALNEEKADFVPDSGWLLEPAQFTFDQGESVFDVLQRACRENRIHLEFSITPLYNSAYIEGIGNLYEFDCGDLSGWTYTVNGKFPNYGCSLLELQDGDVVCWNYSCGL